MSPLTQPPSSLDGFPSARLAPGSRLFRIHRAHRGPWWFSSDGTGRFDLPSASGQGTCYLAEEPAGCFLEVFRDWILVPEKEVDARRISAIALPAGTRLADCTDAGARAFGVTAEIHSTPDYEATRRWAGAFFETGFAGIRYFLRHDPGQTLAGVALFGPAGEPARPPGDAEPARNIGRQVIEDVGRRFGTRVLPTP